MCGMRFQRRGSTFKGGGSFLLGMRGAGSQGPDVTVSEVEREEGRGPVAMAGLLVAIVMSKVRV